MKKKNRVKERTKTRTGEIEGERGRWRGGVREREKWIERVSLKKGGKKKFVFDR